MNIKGIDLSKHQKGLTINAVKKVGFDFAILRGGYTGYGSSRPKVKDTEFENFYKQAQSNNFPVGVYYYSCANTKQDGIDEAKFLYDNCLKGKTFEYPIYIDVENEVWQMKDKENVTEAIIGFCDTLEDLGYFVGVYMSLSWFNEHVYADRLQSYTKWVAAWRNEKPQFKYNGFDMWQNSDNGVIGTYVVDTDICYKDFPTIIKNAGLNGYSKSLKEETKENADISNGNGDNGDIIEAGDDFVKTADEAKEYLNAFLKFTKEYFNK